MNEKMLDIAVIGLGGAGGNIIAELYKSVGSQLKDVEFAALNTDVQALNILSEAGFPDEYIYQIGERATRGLGAGSVPDVGKSAAQEDIDILRKIIADKDLVMVITGLGGGTGSGVAPVLLEEIKNEEILSLCWTVMPFEYEGAKRNKIAKKALKEIDAVTDSYVVIANDAPESLIFKDGMDEINDKISSGTQIILEVLSNPSLINLDFADFTTVLENGSKSLFNSASFDGNKRDQKVTKELLKFSLQPAASPKKVKRAMIFISGGSDMRKDELKTITDGIRKRLNDDALVVMGVSVTNDKESLDAVFLGTTGEKEK